MKPVLRWAGSKRSILTSLAPFWTSAFETYVEPFCGSAALFFFLEAENAILSDVNADLINFYESLRANPVLLHSSVIEIPRDRTTYYSVRDVYNRTTNPTDRAKYFYYLNKNCFNGIFRTSLSGNFNVPFSGYRTGEYPPVEVFKKVAALLEGACLRAGDFERVVAEALAKRCLVYLDPPYANGTRQPFAAYHPKSFVPSDLDRLENLLDQIDQAGSTFILSYSAECDVKKRFARWHIQTLIVRRNISGFAGARKLTTECLFTNCEQANA